MSKCRARYATQSRWIRRAGVFCTPRPHCPVMAVGARQAAEKRFRSVILSEAKNPRSCSFNELRRSFVVPIRSGLLRMTVPRLFPQPVEGSRSGPNAGRFDNFCPEGAHSVSAVGGFQGRQNSKSFVFKARSSRDGGYSRHQTCSRMLPRCEMLGASSVFL